MMADACDVLRQQLSMPVTRNMHDAGLETEAKALMHKHSSAACVGGVGGVVATSGICDPRATQGGTRSPIPLTGHQLFITVIVIVIVVVALFSACVPCSRRDHHTPKCRHDIAQRCSFWTRWCHYPAQGHMRSHQSIGVDFICGGTVSMSHHSV